VSTGPGKATQSRIVPIGPGGEGASARLEGGHGSRHSASLLRGGISRRSPSLLILRVRRPPHPLSRVPIGQVC
jgi:hypothetical protein